MNKLKRFLKILLLTVGILLVSKGFSKAASASITADSTAKVGTPITISVSGTGVQWNLALSVNGTQIAKSQELENYESNKTISFSGTYTPSSTDPLTVTLTGSVTEFNDGSTITSFETKTINIETTQTEQTQETSTKVETTEQPKSEPPKQEKPDFTDANSTMYASKGINLRASWSTESDKIYIEKGTELNVTATSTKVVNGYIWYKVSYNGQTKYVASNLLVDTKPEEEEKSDNANLSSLKVENCELIPTFAPNVTSYTVQVSKETQKIEINAEAEDENATVSIKGNENLTEEGEHTATVSVSAEDGTVKIYEIKVEKLAKEIQKLGLKSLNIEGTNISTKFKPDTYNYEIDIEPRYYRIKNRSIIK